MKLYVNETYDTETETRPRRSRPRLQPWNAAIWATDDQCISKYGWAEQRLRIRSVVVRTMQRDVGSPWWQCRAVTSDANRATGTADTNERKNDRWLDHSTNGRHWCPD